MIQHAMPLRRSWVLLVLGCTLCPATVNADVGVSLQDFSSVAAAPSLTRVYRAREFITMDPDRPRAEAVAVRDGRFVAVGSHAEVMAAAGDDALLDDSFGARIVVPGFIDPHVHPVLAALTMSTKVISIDEWDSVQGYAPAVRDTETYRDHLLRALADHRGKAEPFVTWGYHEAFHGEMSRQMLDDWMPRFPVIVWHRSCAEFYLNTAALEAVGIDAAFIETLAPSQQAEADLKRGRFAGQGAIAVLDRLRPLLASNARLRRGLELTETVFHRNGVTLACEPGGFVSKAVQEAVNDVYSDSATPFNYCFTANGKTLAEDAGEDTDALVRHSRRMPVQGDGRTWYLPKQVKLSTDGDIFRQEMQLKRGGYVGRSGTWSMEPAAFDRAFQAYWDAGYQIHVQNAGDAALDPLIASLEAALSRAPRTDHRTALVGFGFAEPAQVARWAGLGGIVSANPYYVNALASRFARLDVGRKLAQKMVPMKEVLEQDVDFSFHSGMPMAPSKPLLLVWAAVNRLTAEGQIMGPEHQVPREAALRAVTLGAAYSIRQERSVGSIEVGKRANLTILEANPLDVPATWIKDIPVWGTMLEGRVQPAPAPVEYSGAWDEAGRTDVGAGISRAAMRE